MKAPVSSLRPVCPSQHGIRRPHHQGLQGIEFRGAHAPSRAVVGTPAEHSSNQRPASRRLKLGLTGEGARQHTRGRVCSPLQEPSGWIVRVHSESSSNLQNCPPSVFSVFSCSNSLLRLAALCLCAFALKCLSHPCNPCNPWYIPFGCGWPARALCAFSRQCPTRTQSALKTTQQEQTGKTEHGTGTSRLRSLLFRNPQSAIRNRITARPSLALPGWKERRQAGNFCPVRKLSLYPLTICK